VNLSIKHPAMTPEAIKSALQNESKQFGQALDWLEKHMPPSFLDEVSPETRVLIARHLLSFHLQNCFSQIHLSNMALVLCLDAPDADLKILESFGLYAIRYYRAFVSNEAPPFDKTGKYLRIALIVLSDELENKDVLEPVRRDEILEQIRSRSPDIRREEFETLLSGLTPRFMRSMTQDRLSLALDLYFRTQTKDLCQYEVRYNQDWMGKNASVPGKNFSPWKVFHETSALCMATAADISSKAPSLQLVLAWRNVPKYRFLYRLAKMIHHHGLALQKVVATYIDPNSQQNTLILSLGLHGLKGKAAWEEADIDDFLRELTLLKFQDSDDAVETTFVKKALLSGNQAHLVRNFISFAHQSLVYADPYLYSFDNVIDGLCRHPELTIRLCEAFEAKFHPEKADLVRYGELRSDLLERIEALDTGQPPNDQRRKIVLMQALNFIDHILKTNFYCYHKSAFSFRLDPAYLDHVPYQRTEKFPALPYGVFFIRGMHFIAFHIRFKDLARGGVRTVIPENSEQFALERNSIFCEAYNLAYTQQKKNKDIPEGGSKMAILLESFTVFAKEEAIFAQELDKLSLDPSAIAEKINVYRREHRLDFLYSSQRACIESLMTLINCDDSGTLKSQYVIDCLLKPEYIYLGPDENMHNSMIEWIADYSLQCHYRPGRSFMSSKSQDGINHKEYGVTSFGVNVYMQQALLYLKINPEKDPFTIKISGGPDGDVAGNQILNLFRFYPKTARIVALIDISGTIYDPAGLDLSEMARLFERGQPIRHYPPEKLSNGGFLLDLQTIQEETAYAKKTLCWQKTDGKLAQKWLGDNEMNCLYYNNVPQTPCDVFIPAGGRPKTLNESNVHFYLNDAGQPKIKAIVEGANLYLTNGARTALEKKGVLIFKDSSCNKGGVICSSFEVLAGLCMSKEEFIKEKNEYVQEVLAIIGKMALNEARLLLTTHQKTGQPLCLISDQISEKINLFKYQLLDYLENSPLPADSNHFFNRCLLSYCPPLLKKRYAPRIFAMPDIHKKAVIAAYLAANLVYARGLAGPSNAIDILPSLMDSDAF